MRNWKDWTKKAGIRAIKTTAVREAIRNGSREIAGLEIYQKPVVAIK